MEETAILAQAPAAAVPASPAVERAIGAHLAPYASLHTFFGVQAGPMDQELALQKIWDYAVTRAGTEDQTAVLNEINLIKNIVGSSVGGQQPYAKVLAYVGALSDLKEAESRIRSLTY